MPENRIILDSNCRYYPANSGFLVRNQFIPARLNDLLSHLPVKLNYDGAADFIGREPKICCYL